MNGKEKQRKEKERMKVVEAGLIISSLSNMMTSCGMYYAQSAYEIEKVDIIKQYVYWFRIYCLRTRHVRDILA